MPGRTDHPILLCYDGSESAKRAIARAGELFSVHRAIVLHLWESWVAHAPALTAVSGSVHCMAVELDEIADEQSTEVAEEGVVAAQAAGFEAEPLSYPATGPLWRAVVDSAAECDAAAIVMGSRGLSGLSAVLGSVSYGVVHHSDRPVLIVPPAGLSPVG
jgi:nucleotide-binding universal stress UspA family protein